MTLSSMFTPTAKDHRYFIESCKIFTVYATFTDKTFPSVSYRWKYRLNYFIGIFLVKNFF
jgi:hypothetical protein